MLQAPHINQRMRMFVPLEQVQKEWAGCDENHFMSVHLLTILTGQGHISEDSVIFEVSESRADIDLEIIPLQTQLFL